MTLNLIKFFRIKVNFWSRFFQIQAYDTSRPTVSMLKYYPEPKLNIQSYASFKDVYIVYKSMKQRLLSKRKQFYITIVTLHVQLKSFFKEKIFKREFHRIYSFEPYHRGINSSCQVLRRRNFIVEGHWISLQNSK